MSDVVGIGLAGGQGMRARPLTLKAPGYLRSKAAMSFLGRRLIRWVLMILSSEGIKDYYVKNEGFLQGQIGNPSGADSPNKKYYDPRVWLRKGEESFIQRLEIAFEDLNCINRNA